MNWISVADQMPEYGVRVLIYIANNYAVAELDKTLGFICSIEKDMYLNHLITHWMPLPEPPEAKEEG